MVTMPSEKDFKSPKVGPLLEKYLKGRKGVSTENRVRILRLIENMTLGRNAVGYLTESMHGAGWLKLSAFRLQDKCNWNTKRSWQKNWQMFTKVNRRVSHQQSDYFNNIFGKVDSKHMSLTEYRYLHL